jgi:hypothetical protein
MSKFRHHADNTFGLWSYARAADIDGAGFLGRLCNGDKYSSFQR